MTPNSITVVIACKNEEKNIANAINSVLNSDYPSSLIKITVVDGMSTDNSREVIQKIAEKNNNIEYVENSVEIAPAAFNLGIIKSDTQFVQIMGSRHQISPNYIKDAIDILNKNENIACVGGVMDVSYSGFFNRLIVKAINSKFGVGMGNVHSLTRSSYTDTAGVPVFRRDIFAKIGLFDENLVRNQDDELSYRIRKEGYKIFSSTEMKTKYEVRSNITGLSKQYRQYGYWKVFVNKKHKAFTTLRQIFPPLFVLFLVFGFPVLYLLGIPALYWYILLFYVLLGLLFNSGSTLSERLLIPFIIFIIHISYGFGYLMGILDFFILGKEPHSKMKTLTR